jgi:hypothetical protein
MFARPPPACPRRALFSVRSHAPLLRIPAPSAAVSKGCTSTTVHARQHYGAEYGVGVGRTGDAWAIPTKDAALRTLPLDRIQQYVQQFLAYAERHPRLVFKVTAIGTGLAGYRHEDIAPMFARAPANCRLPEEWRGFPPTPQP